MRKFAGIFIFLFISGFSYATHQVGGYISYKWMGGYTYQITINDYTNSCCPLTSIADRDTLRIWFDDGSANDGSQLLWRLNGQSGEQLLGNGDPTPYGELLCNWELGPPLNSLSGARKYNMYQCVHTFPGPGNYHLWMDDQDRMEFIDNISGSVNVDLYLYNTLTIPLGDTSLISSPLITNPPVCQFGCVGQCYTYNPGAYIPNLPSGADDSISYILGSSLQLNPAHPTMPEIANGYTNPGATVNDTTGTLTWCNPEYGLWNFVILMVTYQRSYATIGGLTIKTIEPIDTTELELEVDIDKSCVNPSVNSIDTCVIAGSSLALHFTAYPETPSEQLYIYGEGEPFSLSPSATLTPSGGPFASPVNTTLNWTTNCSEVREDPYEAVIRATERVPNAYNADTEYYSGYGTALIRVVGPPPPHLMANVEGTTVCLHWGPSPCPQATGYNIYRGIGCQHWKDNCTTGVPVGSGFTLIASNVGINDTTYCDSNSGQGLSPGVNYSYIVDAFYPLPDGSQSLASNDTCVLIKLSVPLITNVSVTKTDPINGEMFVRWHKPLADANDLDTNAYPPPYKYILEHATGMNGANFSAIATVISPHFNSIIDTTFSDVGLNTQQNSYNYKVDFYYWNTISLSYLPVGTSGTASSTYLELQREDKSMNLGWSASVPWTSDTFFVYRQNPAPPVQPYNFIAKVIGSNRYTDTGLSNGYTYCYYVKSSNHYLDPNILHPLYDSSETICGTPEDTIAPCSPPFTVSAKCVLYEDSLIWSNPTNLCPRANKVVGYQIYYTATQDGGMDLIATITNPNQTVYVNSNLTSVAGCYAVLAVDSAGQTSPFNNVCVDNCPDYQLPNVFTPNGDASNDLYHPLEPFRYVRDIDINIFNRWGQVVFHTSDPTINWNGNVDNSGGTCPAGTYYYICVVNEIRLQGIVPVTLKGFIQLIR